jgi:predicted kinase
VADNGPSKLLVLVTGLQGTGKSTVAALAAERLGAPVLAHDWAMSGLRPYPEVQTALDAMGPPGHRAVGWSILSALARSQFRRGCSVVLDGVARTPEISLCRDLARDEGARFVLVMTQCADVELHRSRITGRQRQIPNWYELDWDHVQRARAAWETPKGLDLTLDAGSPLADNAALLRTLLDGLGPDNG